MATCFGTSHGKRMTWLQHMHNYASKDRAHGRDVELLERIKELTELMNNSFKEFDRDMAKAILLAEFGSMGAVMEQSNRITDDLFKGWVPLTR